MFIFLITLGRHSIAAEVVVAWDQINDSRVAGYELHYGASSQNYDTTLDVGDNSTSTVGGLDPGKTYFFAVRAYSQDRSLWSDFSEEVSGTPAVPPPPVNQPPLADAGGPYTATAGESVAFNGAGSSDPDGSIVDYSWEFGDGSTSSGATPTHTYSAAGTYTAILTVTDNSNAQSNAAASVTIEAVTATPVASFTTSATSGIAPLLVNFTDTSTGDIDSWAWDFGDNTTSTTAMNAHTYTSPGTYSVSLTVTGPGGSDTETDLVTVMSAAPEADFTMSRSSGPAPLDITFADNSSGDITGYHWNFGDGSTSSAASPAHTYTTPGDYTVTYTVTGPGGSDTKTADVQVSDKSDLLIEVGEVSLDHQWVRVDLEQTFSDPVVIAKPLSHNGSDPAVVRVDAVDGNGFWIRVQEWDYLDGWHTTETASYIVMESGTHQLPNGTWIEAGHVNVENGGWVSTSLSPSFNNAPVVLTTVTTFNEADTVTTRLRNINKTGFQVKLQEQEANPQMHLSEAVDYIAWEPSAGDIEGLLFEVGRTGDQVKHAAHTIGFSTSFDEPPLFLADMQSTDGGDTANLRWDNKGASSVDVWVDEEQSKDSEINHITETVGYVALTPVAPTTGPEPTTYSMWSDADVPANPTEPDPNAVELGVKFTSDISGHVTGIRFYKGPENTGIHVANLWTIGGTLLASATFDNETDTGWQQVNFATPVEISADTVYVASYHAPNGKYADDVGYFAGQDADNGPLHFLRDGATGGNGVYAYGASSSFPTNTWNSSNYWVDVVFTADP